MLFVQLAMSGSGVLTDVKDKDKDKDKDRDRDDDVDASSRVIERSPCARSWVDCRCDREPRRPSRSAAAAVTVVASCASA
jgi:hypothetical protein